MAIKIIAIYKGYMENKYSIFKQKEVVIVLRGKTSFNLNTSEGIVSTNTFYGYLVDEDKYHLFVSVESPTNYTTLINKNEVAILSLAPDMNEVTIEFNSEFDTDLN